MQKRKNNIALIPAFEPSNTLVELSKSMSANGFEVIIIDDGSPDAYKPIFKTASEYATVLTHELNRGKGRALKTGLSYVMDHFLAAATIVTLDSDGQHRAEDAIRVCHAASVSDGCLVLGSRSFDGKVPAKSKLGNTATRFVYRITTGVSVHDTQTGLRAFGLKLIPFMLRIEGERYEYEINVLLECTRQAIPIMEINIETIYFENNTGTHFDIVKDSALIYGNILRFAASSFTGFLVDFGIYSLMIFFSQGLGTAVSVPVSNIAARMVSTVVNFSMNKRFVFNNKDSIIKTASQYFALAVCILIGNTIILSFMVEHLNFNLFGSKILAEIIFFTVSWLVQRFVIFKKKDIHHIQFSGGVKQTHEK